MKKKIYSVVLFFFLAIISYSQSTHKIKKSICAQFQIPKAISNKAFRSTFSGVLNVGASMNFSRNNFTVGPFYSIMQFQVFPKYFDDSHALETTQTGGLRFAYDKLTQSGNGMWSPFIAPGFSYINYTRLKYNTLPPTITKINTYSLNAGVAYNFMINEFTGVGFIIGYNIVENTFNPKAISLDQYYTFQSGDDVGYTNHIFIGFSAYFSLSKRPEGEGGSDE